MGKETEPLANISELNSAWPLIDDKRSEGDDHLRMIKQAIVGTWPNVAGEISFTEEQANYLAGVTAGIALASKALVLDANSDLLSGINDFNIGGALNVNGTSVFFDNVANILKSAGNIELTRASAAILFNNITEGYRSRITCNDGGSGSPDFAIRSGHYVDGTTEKAIVAGDAAALMKVSTQNRSDGRIIFSVAGAAVGTDNTIGWDRRLKIDADANLQLDNGSGYQDVATIDDVNTVQTNLDLAIATHNAIKATKLSTINHNNNNEHSWDTMSFTRNHNGRMVATVSAEDFSPLSSGAICKTDIIMKRPSGSTVERISVASSTLASSFTITFLDTSPENGTYSLVTQKTNGDTTAYSNGTWVMQEMDN